MSAHIIDTVEGIREFIETIETASPPPFIFVDLEGVNLSRHGTVAIMQVLVPPEPVVHLVDIHTLQHDAFSTPGPGGETLQSLLESSRYPKVFFDVRNDSDALYGHFQVNLRCVVDLQLLEFASRPRRTRFVNGLARCISSEVAFNYAQRQEWESVKEAGRKLFAPEKGGTYEVFLERPLPETLVKYCVQDVLVLPKLLLIYAGRLHSDLAAQIQTEVLRRIALSQSPTFDGKGQHMAIGPSFSRVRSARSTVLDFPMILVCSPSLAKRCTLNETVVAEADTTEALGTVEATSVTDSVESAATASTIDALLHAMNSLKVAEPTTGRSVTEEGGSDEQEDEFESGGYLYSSGYRSASPEECEKDFTACSSSDCGYCGHCGY